MTYFKVLDKSDFAQKPISPEIINIFWGFRMVPELISFFFRYKWLPNAVTKKGIKMKMTIEVAAENQLSPAIMDQKWLVTNGTQNYYYYMAIYSIIVMAIYSN